MTLQEAQEIAERIAALQAEIDELIAELNEAEYVLLDGNVYERYEHDDDK